MHGELNLGQIITTKQNRDAIHIAVAPVVAAHQLWTGCRVGLTPNGLATTKEPAIGIVDPFLPGGTVVEAGQTFWLFLYPLTVTGLRHDWQHPAFPQESRTYIPAGAGISEAWIREYADRLGLGYEALMGGARDWLYSRKKDRWGDYLVMGGLLEGESTEPLFWHHFELVTGEQVPEEHKENFFSCSC